MTSVVDVREAPVAVGRDEADPRQWRALLVTCWRRSRCCFDGNPYGEL